MRVCGREFTDEIIRRIQMTMQAEPTLSRSALSRRVCEWMDWRSATGAWKEMSCRVALLALHRRGIIQLPPPRIEFVSRGRGANSGLTEAGEGAEVAGDLSELGRIEVVPIDQGGSAQAREWTALMDRYHYLGSGPLCGAQMRYLIGSERYGWLGGLSFSASAWKVKARDEWVGWDEAARQRNLPKVVCNSRFLIVPGVRVPNLASHVLSLCAGRLGEDWQKRYGLEPVLLETYVERERFWATCYQAANWIHVGSTQGRGRQDRENAYGVPVKEVYVYRLEKDARQRLCEGMSNRGAVEERARGPADWAEEEFGGVDLRDERLGKRLMSLARDLYGKPQASIPQACGSRAKTKAAYRFFDHEQTTMDNILRPHYQSTLKRIKEQKVVLAVQDTTSLNYSAHPATEGLGPINTRKDEAVGLLLHSTLAFTVEGTPLGLMDVQCWVRDAEDFGKKERRYEVPIEQKESYKWLKSYQAASRAQKRCPKTLLVSVGDREADVYELFELAQRDAEGPKLLVRAERHRLLADGQGHLWEKVASEPLAGVQQVQIPRRGNQPGRKARLEVRFAEVVLKPPKRKPNLTTVKVWAVLAREMDAPEGVEPLQWMLLSTVEVRTFEDAVERLAWYAVRWGIEVYHRTLKSGCKIEERQLGGADRIEACLAIDMVVGWRIFYLTKLGRETPEVPCTVFFEEAEWKALVAYKTQNVVPPARPPTLREATRMVASLGGFLGRKGDGEPGTQTLWLGLQRLDDLTAMWKCFVAQLVPEWLPPVSSTDYG